MVTASVSVGVCLRAYSDDQIWSQRLSRRRPSASVRRPGRCLPSWRYRVAVPFYCLVASVRITVRLASGGLIVCWTGAHADSSHCVERQLYNQSCGAQRSICGVHIDALVDCSATLDCSCDDSVFRYSVLPVYYLLIVSLDALPVIAM
jgi:hypothetical protein